MKVIEYQYLSAILDDKEPFFVGKTIPYSSKNEEIAKAESYNGEYIIEDDGQPDPIDQPSQLDRIEAQIAYLAMMTGNAEILEV